MWWCGIMLLEHDTTVYNRGRLKPESRVSYFYYTTHVDVEFYLTKPRLQNNLVWCGQGLRVSLWHHSST